MTLWFALLNTEVPVILVSRRAEQYWEKKIITLISFFHHFLYHSPLWSPTLLLVLKGQSHVADWLIVRNIKWEYFLSNTITFVFRTRDTCPPSTTFMEIFESSINYSLHRGFLQYSMAWSPEPFPLAARICYPLPPSFFSFTSFSVPLLLKLVNWLSLWGRLQLMGKRHSYLPCESD